MAKPREQKGARGPGQARGSPGGGADRPGSRGLEPDALAMVTNKQAPLRHGQEFELAPQQMIALRMLGRSDPGR